MAEHAPDAGTPGRAAPASGWAFVIGAAVIGAFALAFLTRDADDDSRAIGLVILAPAVLLGLIGAIAVGVEVGLARRDWKNRQVEAPGG